MTTLVIPNQNLLLFVFTVALPVEVDVDARIGVLAHGTQRFQFAYLLAGVISLHFRRCAARRS